MKAMVTTPKTYQEWMSCFEYLSNRIPSDKDISLIYEGICPGVETVQVQFMERLNETVNNMLNLSTKNCTRLLNEALEEGDLSNIETILRRGYKDIQRCRFYRSVEFIPIEYVKELDSKTVSEINRYWNLMKRFFCDLVDETNNSDLDDMVYYVNRLIVRDKRNGKL